MQVLLVTSLLVHPSSSSLWLTRKMTWFNLFNCLILCGVTSPCSIRLPFIFSACLNRHYSYQYLCPHCPDLSAMSSVRSLNPRGWPLGKRKGAGGGARRLQKPSKAQRFQEMRGNPALQLPPLLRTCTLYTYSHSCLQ